VIGVVENRPMDLMGLGATSSIFYLHPSSVYIPSIRIARSDVPAAIREIESVWNTLAPRVAFKWQFADALMNETQQTLGILSATFGVVAAFALVVAVLGLIGMSFHVIRRRQHEIGVRKTLGASVRQVLILLLADFSRPVVIANLIAWPIAFVAMQIYLGLFTQRIGLTATPFVLSLILTLFIAWISVAIQATRAARLNPATVLRYE